MEYGARLDWVLGDVSTASGSSGGSQVAGSTKASSSLGDLERSLGLATVTATASGGTGFVFSAPASEGGVARGAASTEPEPEPEPEPTTAVPADGEHSAPQQHNAGTGGEAVDFATSLRLSPAQPSGGGAGTEFQVGQRVRFRDLAGARIATVAAGTGRPYSVHVPGIGIVADVAATDLAPLTLSSPTSARTQRGQLSPLPLMAAGMPSSFRSPGLMAAFETPRTPSTPQAGETAGVSEENVSAISEQVTKQVQSALQENLGQLQKTLTESMSSQLQELHSQLSPPAGQRRGGGGGGGQFGAGGDSSNSNLPDQDAMKAAAAAELYNSERQRAQADVALLVAEQAKAAAQEELERQRRAAEEAEEKASQRHGQIEQRLAAEQARANDVARAAEAAKESLEADWASKMAGAEQDKVERIAELDRQMAARQADAEKYLAQTKAEAAEAVAESQRQADRQIKEREAKLREMELDFLRQQHKSRHLERLSKMKLGYLSVCHIISTWTRCDCDCSLPGLPRQALVRPIGSGSQRSARAFDRMNANYIHIYI